VSYYSIIHTPKKGVGRLFREFHRVMSPGGSLLVAVKAGSGEGDVGEFLGTRAEIHFSYFSEAEIAAHFTRAGFAVDFMERRNPYGFEIQNGRIFAIGTKVTQQGRFDR
jgi:predicted methyltransferase